MAPFAGGHTDSFARTSQQQYASSSTVTSQPSLSDKSPAISLATLAKASEVLNGLFEKDAQMVPELRDTLAGDSVFIYSFHGPWSNTFRPIFGGI